MQTFGAFLIAALAASGELAAALPSNMDTVRPRAGPGGSMAVKVRPRAATYGYKHPALAMAKAVNKYNASMPAHLDAIVKSYRGTSTVRSGATKRGEGSATTTPEAYDEAYITNIKVGTPAQTLPMDFDTGSSDLWVFSSETSSSEVNGQKTYDISSSSTASKMTGASWKISYGDGSSSSGNVYTDVVSIGNISVTGQAVESATSVSTSFTSDSSSSGLVGLAMSTLNTVSPTAQKTFFDNAKSQLSAALFTADLKHDTAGTYTFGALDSSSYTGTIFYADLFNSSASLSGYWTFQSSGYAVGNGTTTTTATTSSTSQTSTSPFGASASDIFGSSSSNAHGSGHSAGGGGGGGHGFKKWVRSLFGKEQPRATRQHAPVAAGTAASSSTEKRAVTLTSTTITGIADTGTTLLMLPDDVVAAYYSQVSGAQDSQTEGGYVFSCDSDLPDFSFGVGSGTVTVPGRYINWAAVDTTNTTCYGGIQSDSSIGFSIFGDIALKAAYVVFDGAQGRVGWAAKTLST